MASPRACPFSRRSRACGSGAMCRRGAALTAALSRGGMALLFALAGTAFLATARLLVHGGPCPPFGFTGRGAAMFVAFGDVFRLTFLLAAILRLVSAWHDF